MNEPVLRSTSWNFPPILVFEIVLYRLCYKLSLRNLAEIFLLCSFQFTHEAVRDWEARFAPGCAAEDAHCKKEKSWFGPHQTSTGNLRDRLVTFLSLWSPLARSSGYPAHTLGS
jgi:hypothetical protein